MSLAFASHAKPCVPTDQAGHLLHKDVCSTAHVCDIVELPDGTRYLDVCSPDEKCVFTILNPWQDREQVGELRQYRNLEVHIRGIAEPMHGRAGTILIHARQFTGDQSRPPMRDPRMHASGSHRPFMNPAERKLVPSAGSSTR
jgi:hypothetical protein